MYRNSDSTESARRLLYFNGVRADSGTYAREPMELRRFFASLPRPHGGDERPLMPGLDPRDLADTGWGVVFAETIGDDVKEALGPLLHHRRAQATARDDRYRERLYHGWQTAADLLEALGTSPGNPMDGHSPYYVLLVGDPTQVPFEVQNQLAVACAAGRICFNTAEDYARYAAAVVEAEAKGAEHVRPRTAAVFGVENPEDQITRLCTEYLVRPLVERLATDRPDWQVEAIEREATTKQRLADLLGGPQTPTLLLTVSHGLVFYSGDRDQLRHQGALLCREWPGAAGWKKRIPESFFFSADDVATDADLSGRITFHFACYSGGSPELDALARDTSQGRERIAPRPFLARLPQRLLRGGALASIAHVDQAFEDAFLWRPAGKESQIQTFVATLGQLMDGLPVGHAVEAFNLKHSIIGNMLLSSHLNLDGQAAIDDVKYSQLWTGYHDARNYVVFGDPAARLQLDAR